MSGFASSVFLTVLGIAFGCSAQAPASDSAGKSIPFEQLGTEAQKQYSGEGISIVATPEGARLRATFQKLEAEATKEGLWLESMESAGKRERFRVLARGVGREGGVAVELAGRGQVVVTGTEVGFVRQGLIEEYRVSMDGVRQDFLVMERPAGKKELTVALEVTGAAVKATADGVMLVLDGSRREIAYSRLRVTDAAGRELQARMEVKGPGHFRICVDDAEAVYPVRIDPTFSDADWVSMGGYPGVNDTVNAIVLDDSGNLYVGGRFTIAGAVFANRIAKWDGNNWSSLGSGLDGEVFALAVDGDNVYAGGYFTTAGGIAARSISKWNGESWTPLGSGMNGQVAALAVSGNDLYAGGYFTQAGGVAANRIAKWNGSTWSALSTGTSGSVRALVVSGTDLYVGGSFATAGEIAAKSVAKWDGNTWSALSSGTNGSVYALVASGTALFAAGYFDTAGGVSANSIAKWDGSSWSPLGLGLRIYTPTGYDVGSVWALAVSGSNLYAGGGFIRAGELSVNLMAKWDGSTWSALGSGMGVAINAMATVGPDLYAGGANPNAAGAPTPTLIAKWTGTSWNSLNSGIGSSVNALAISGTDLYAAGSFKIAGEVNLNRVVKWDGSAWSALRSEMSGINEGVSTLAVSGADLYAGGLFNSVGGVAAKNIAKWNGSTWSALGAGVNDQVTALLVSGGEVYAGGTFTLAGGISASRIAKWSGTSWSALGSGVDHYVLALAGSGTELYAAGRFMVAGGVEAKRIAKWDGSSWSALGSGLNNNVSSLALAGGDLFVGGDFSTAGGMSANYIAKWNGSGWSALGSGMNGAVFALTSSGSDLYAGGGFTLAGGVSANFIAKWDGSNWTALGQGMGASVYELVSSGADLFASGVFTSAGGRVSAYVAKAILIHAQMTLRGKDVEIGNGDLSPEDSDDTRFGGAYMPGGSVAHTFVISNTVSPLLRLTGNPRVQISGDHASDFSVTSQPSSSVAQDSSTNFTITFSPSATGLRSAVVNIANNAGSPHTFAIQGEGVRAGEVSFTLATYRVDQDAASVDLTVQRTGGTFPFQVVINTHNGTKELPFAPAKAGADYLDLTGSGTTISFADGVNSKTVKVPLVANKAASAPNKRFTASLSAPNNGATLGMIATTTIQILANDTKEPTLTLTAPAGRVSAAWPCLVRGIAGDAKGIVRVEVALNEEDPVVAILGAATASTSVPYSLGIHPDEGLNTIVATAYDLRGHSVSVTRDFTFVRRYVLAVSRTVPTTKTDATGVLAMVATPAASATALSPTLANSNPQSSHIVPGTMVKLTATAKAGFLFNEWLGLPEDASILGNTVTFGMPAADLALTADFISTTFAAPAGETNTFFGLIRPTEATVSSNATEGFFTGTLTTSGAFTGKVLIDGVSQPVTATYFGDGSAVFTSGAAKQSSLTFGGRVLTLSMNAGSLVTKVVKGANTSEGSARRLAYSTTRKVRPQLLNSATKGFYTVSLLAKEQLPTMEPNLYPQGDGFATLSVSNVGVVSLTGTLADGSAITASSGLIGGDVSPIFVPLATPGGTAANLGGSLSGPLVFDETLGDSDVTAVGLRWFRPAALGTKTLLYTAGWPGGIRVDAVGARYATTTKVQATLGLAGPDAMAGNATLRFTAGKLASDVIKTKFNIVGNAVTKIAPVDGSYVLTLAPATGSFSGTFTPNWAPLAATKPAFKGILLQKGANAGGLGFFISNAKNDGDPESGSVILRAP